RACTTTSFISGQRMLLLALLLVPLTAPVASERVDRLVQTALQLDRHRANGAKVYPQYCSQCHGKAATGDVTKVIPSLAGQRRSYLVKQLADFAEQQRESQDMHAVIARKALSEPQVWTDLAAYLNTLPAPAEPEIGDG